MNEKGEKSTAHLAALSRQRGVELVEQLVAGGSPTLLATAVLPGPIARDATHLYFADGSTGAISLASADGSAVTTLATASQPKGIAVDGSHVYWTDNGTGNVMKVALGGGFPV
jgi:hypothetical protein